MILKEALNYGIEKLKQADIITPEADAGVILCSVLHRDRVFLYTHSDYVLSNNEQRLFAEHMEKRSEGVPVQYLTGNQEFMSLDFKVGPGVLIPRHDTEILVETIMQYTKTHGLSNTRILELGTGSGCIAVSLAHYIPDCNVVAADISQQALHIARENALNNGVASRITFLESNLFKKLSFINEKFDIIVSNPPYIKTSDIGTLQKEVKGYEPLTALDGGPDGLDFYRAISEQAPGYLRRSGFLAFEIGYDQADEVSALMEDKYSEIQVVKDFAGNCRVVTGILK